MASGKKNYFRHSFIAHDDIKLNLLRDKIGIGYYFYYFSLLEICGEESADDLKTQYEFHDSTIRSLWRINLKKSEHVASAMNAVGLLEFKKGEKSFVFTIPNLAKYLGKYTNKKTSNSPNKRKEKEIKEKERKEKETENILGPPEWEIINLFNQIIAGNGRVQYYAGVVLPPRARDDYITLCGFPEFQTPEDYEEYFKLISETPKLMGTDERFNINITLPWIINPDNAMKIKSGQYKADVTEGEAWLEGYQKAFAEVVPIGENNGR